MRFFDIVFSFLSLLILFPLFLIIIILIRMESSGKAIFKQKRVGRYGKYFTMYKFRSMYHDKSRFVGNVNEEDYSKLSHEEKIKLKEAFKPTDVKNDKRITKVGKFIRRTSIDELPQLFNVLKGDLSLVGPRPHTPVAEINFTKDAWNERHLCRPGITGISQISGRSYITSDLKLEKDLFWVRKRSFVLYMSVLFKTFFQIIFKKNQSN